MRLRTFESFWLLQNGLMYSYPLLEENIKTEIVVIGGGIAGALISDALLDAGYKVVILDKRDIAQGSSSATTSMLQYEIDEKLIDLADLIGEEGAATCYQAGIDALNELEMLVEKKKLNCGFEKKKSLYIAHNKKAAKELLQEFEIRKKYKLGVQWLTPERIKEAYGVESEGGILSANAASVDAYRLTHELIYKNTKRGLRVHDQTEIADFSCGTRGITVTTKAGYTVKADKIVFCNGFESTLFLKEKIADLFYTYACISEKGIKLPKKVFNTLIWDTADPYLYIRTTSDGRLLVGGEDEDFLIQNGQQSKKEIKATRLIKKLQKLMPDIHFIEDFSWGGIFGSTKDGLPYIGKSAEYTNALFVLGFGGNGITFSIQARNIIKDLLAGKNNPLAHYYRFGR